VDRRKGIENAASFRANGTGPFRVRERQPGVRTTFSRNGNYWGKIASNVDEVIYTPIGNDATRVAAILSGEVDVMEPVPVQDVERIKANPKAQCAARPRAAGDLFGHGPSARRTALQQRQGQKPLQRQARAPSLLPSD
jgi:peptide/nickel transport system substrate-binding protein